MSVYMYEIPSLLNPYLLITALSSSNLNTRGLGFPGWGNGVTLPISTNPNPYITLYSIHNTHTLNIFMGCNFIK